MSVFCQIDAEETTPMSTATARVLRPSVMSRPAMAHLH